MNHDDSPDAVERKQKVAGVFHRASSTFDHVGPGFFAHFGRRLVVQASLPLHARVLDVACGRGATLFPAAEAVGAQGFVTGIDLAEGMIQETAREAKQRGLSNVEVRQMDAEHLDYPDSSFDATLCGFALFFFPQLELALAEIQRTLKPGGRIAVSTWGNMFDKEWEWFDNLVERYRLPKPQDEQNPAPSDDPDFDTPDGMQKIFKTAGFVDVQVVSEVADFTYSTSEEWWETLWSHGFRKILEDIEKTGGPEALANFKVECLGQMADRRGSQDVQQSFQVLYTIAMNPSP